jgi:hypothetical protein
MQVEKLFARVTIQKQEIMCFTRSLDTHSPSIMMCTIYIVVTLSSSLIDIGIGMIVMGTALVDTPRLMTKLAERPTSSRALDSSNLRADMDDRRREGRLFLLAPVSMFCPFIMRRKSL